MKKPEATASIKLARDKLLGFRHLAALDGEGDLTQQADDLFTKRPGEGPGGDKTDDSTNELVSRADELFTKRLETPTSPKRS